MTVDSYCEKHKDIVATITHIKNRNKLFSYMLAVKTQSCNTAINKKIPKVLPNKMYLYKLLVEIH